MTNSNLIESPAGSGALSFAEPGNRHPQYASFSRRFLAYALDNLFLAILTFVVMTQAMGENDSASIRLDTCLAFFWLFYGFYTTAFLGYFTLMTAGTGGATIGKRLLGIKVTLTDGRDVTYGRALARSIGYYISTIFLYIGFLIAIIDKRHQTFHDKITGTVVVEID